MKKKKGLLFLIIAFAFIVRIWQIGQIPTFISDEASIGYNAYSILNTGRDEWGEFLPLSFKGFGEYKLPVYIYSVVPSVAIFGLSEFATRLPSVLAGLATIFLLYLLSSRLFSTKIGLLSAALLAISPWHIAVSRMALEANLALGLVLAGFWLLTFASKNKKALFASFFLLTLSFYTYNACRVFVPLFLFAFFFTNRKTWGPVLKSGWLAVVMAAFLSLPIFLSGFQGSSQRLAQVGIFSDPGILNQVIEKRLSCQEKSPVFFCRVLYNRPVAYSQSFVENYFSHFSLNYLFFRGSGLAQYLPPGKGALYLIELPFILLGIFFLLKRKEARSFFGLWVLIAPVANSLTGGAHPVRALVLLPVFPVLTALGIFWLGSKVKTKIIKRLILFLVGGVFLASFVSFLISYFIIYQQAPGSTWQGGYKTLYSKLAKQENHFDKIMITKFYGEPHIFYLFYSKFNPESYQSSLGVVRYERDDHWINVDRIGQYYFLQEILIEDKDILYAIAPQELKGDFTTLDKIIWLNREPSFLIGKMQ